MHLFKAQVISKICAKLLLKRLLEATYVFHNLDLIIGPTKLLLLE
jgi:hypothetical protein